MLAARSKVAERQALTEEATKTSVVLPFLQALGFDVFNLDEVIPEFVSDIGTKKGEKVDYAVKIDGKIAMLVEAKPISTRLGDTQFNQLFRYFTVTEARLAVLTNGKEVWFFSDTESPNKMDGKPFFTFDLQRPDKQKTFQLAKFQKENFQIESILETASALKYSRDAAEFLKRQLLNPDDDFVKLVGRAIHEGSVTKSVMEQLRPAIQSALDEIIRDRIQDKLSITLRGDPVPALKVETAREEDEESVTTEEEVEAFMIVRAIAARIVPVSRVVMRDAKSYCAIIMDDSNRNPICRLHFNSSKVKYIGLFDDQKVETRNRIETPADIYKFSEALEAAVRRYSER